MPIGKVAHTHLPYCMQRTADGSWLALNRLYKPLGVINKDWVDYDTHPARLHLTAPSVKALLAVATLVYDGPDGKPDLLFFYEDHLSPVVSAAHAAAYFKRLDVFSRAKLKAVKH